MIFFYALMSLSVPIWHWGHLKVLLNPNFDEDFHNFHKFFKVWCSWQIITLHWAYYLCWSNIVWNNYKVIRALFVSSYFLFVYLLVLPSLCLQFKECEYEYYIIFIFTKWCWNKKIFLVYWSNKIKMIIIIIHAEVKY